MTGLTPRAPCSVKADDPTVQPRLKLIGAESKAEGGKKEREGDDAKGQRERQQAELDKLEKEAEEARIAADKLEKERIEAEKEAKRIAAEKEAEDLKKPKSNSPQTDDTPGDVEEFDNFRYGIALLTPNS